jgi:hypothetical protein
MAGMDLKTIIVLWMDDREETYPQVETIVRDGVLHIHQYVPKTLKRIREWHWSLYNIRGWWPADQEPLEG